MNDTAKTPSSGTAPTLTHTLPIYPGFPPHQGSSLLVHHNPATGQHLPTIPMHDVPPRWQPQSVFMNGVPSTLGASAQNHLSVNNQMTPTAQHQTQNQFPMATPAGSSMMMNNVPWQSPDFFGGVPKTEAPQMAEHDNSSVPVVMAAFNPTPHMNALTLNNDKIMVPLTHDEYIWIQHARTAGVDFSKLPKFIPEQRENTLEAHNLTPCSIPQPSPMHFPANMATAQPTPVTHSMPEPTKPKAGGCCKSKSVPSITTTATAEILPSPSSPRCKCGDACRCVPCADHPFNPAMLETIKGDMLLLQDPNNKKPSSCCSTSTPTHQPDNETSNSPAMYDQDTYGDKNSPANTGDAGIMADFNFVFQNYNYGSGCTEGRGGCMCGEGCTCVGCLTHGGHDGVIFNILGDTATNTAMGHVNENTNAASTPREEHQHQNQHHQQHNQQNQQTDQNHRA
ncbi:hypothetical protein EX30DRAFT_103581 [Ascodesmis nigricans]|uniref:Copper-fist domain-containing protein n=1 Tax=Ascodesmis nigricans TaxID=341454 RepID=A0A4S2N5A0_9PEZI|nr:hypothetical protein EX30DRAFT_103581 [Ascodesmis nigricans]